jgi:eukaryotic-like serine/threonine-protein kinase
MSPRLGLPALAAALLASAAPGDEGWSQPRGDAANTAFVELDAPHSERPRAWSFEGTSRVMGYEPGMTVWSPPALGVIDGRATVFVGGHDRLVYALDAATGEVRWRYTTGDGVFAAPVLWRDGAQLVVLAASNDREVYALEATSGRRLWSTALEAWRPTLGGARLTSPCLGQVAGVDALFVGQWVHDASLGRSLQRASLVALSAREGKRLWTQSLGDNELTAPLCARVGGAGRLYLGSADGNLHALDMQTGARVWTHLEHDGIRSPPAFVVLDDGTALLVTGSRYGEVRALEAGSGIERWRFKTGDRITGSPAVARVGGRQLVFVPSYDRTLYALDASTGAVAWRAAARGGFFSSPAVVAGPTPTVLALAWDHALHAVDALTGLERFAAFTGRPLWDVGGLDASTWSSPAVARFGGQEVAFVGSYDGRFRALPLDAKVVATPVERRTALFWLSFPATVGPLVLAALWLTRRARRRERGGVGGIRD